MSYPIHTENLTLGETYTIRYRGIGKPTRGKFIQVTRKGFNFLNERTHKCLYRRHFYARKFSNKPLPDTKSTFRITLPNWLIITNNNYEKNYKT